MGLSDSTQRPGWSGLIARFAVPANLVSIGRVVVRAVLAVQFAALVVMHVIWLRSPLDSQDEAMILVYTDAIGQGRFPYRDIESVYSMGLSVPLRPLFAVVADDVLLIRLISLILLLVTSWLLFQRLRPQPLLRYVVPVALAAVWPTPTLYWCFALGALAIGVIGTEATCPRRRWLGYLLIGFSMSVRYDFAVIALPLIAAGLLDDRPGGVALKKSSRWRSVGVPFVIGFAPGLVSAIQVVFNVGLSRWIESQSLVRQGRYIPIDSDEKRMLFAVAIGLVVVTAGLMASIRISSSPRIKWERLRFWSVPGAVLLGAIQMIQRFDRWHIHYAVSLVAVVVVPILVRWVTTRPGESWRRVGISLLGALAFVLMLQVAPNRNYLREFVNMSPSQVGVLQMPPSARLCGDRRCLDLPQRAATDYAEIVAYVNANPNKSVFVGPLDLRGAYYSDNWLYALWSNEFCSRFLELNPGSTNAKDGVLAADLADCDLLVLTSVYDGFFQNDWSRRKAAASTNNEILQDFRVVMSSGNAVLFERITGA